MRAVVHHGGAGTTAEGLRAGCPTLACPFFLDQEYWGMRVAALGLGPKPLPIRKMSIRSLVSRIRDLTTNREYALRAVQIAQSLRLENGVGRAVEIIEQIVGKP